METTLTSRASHPVRGSLTSGALIHDKYGPRYRFLELFSLFEAFISDLCYSLSQQHFRIDKKSTILHQHLQALLELRLF